MSFLTSGRRLPRAWRGFTLIEMLVVLAVLGLMAGLIVARGPMRSQRLEMDAAARDIAGALRLARSRAIARDQPVTLAIDVAGHRYAMDGAQPHPLPPGLAITVTAVTSDIASSTVAGITFAPDGSSTGGRIELAGNGRRVQVGVDWLTGRVRIAEGL